MQAVPRLTQEKHVGDVIEFRPAGRMYRFSPSGFWTCFLRFPILVKLDSPCLDTIDTALRMAVGDFCI